MRLLKLMEKYTLIQNKRAQAWGFDLIIAIIIFSIGIVALYLYAINFSNEVDENLNALLYEGNLVSSNLLSQGSPANWSSYDLSSLDFMNMPGLLENNKIDNNKLKNFSILSNNPDIKNKLNTKFNFCFAISGIEFAADYPSSAYPYGICTADKNDVQNEIKITRFVVYKNIPRKFELTIWK